MNKALYKFLAIPKNSLPPTYRKNLKKTSSIDSVYALTPTENAMQRYNWLFLTRTCV